MQAQGAAAAWEQLPLGVQQHILVLTGSPCARRVSKPSRDAFDAANDTLSFSRIHHPDQSLKVAATAAATRVVKNSASLTAVNYEVQPWDGITPLPLMLPDLLAAGAASGLATRLRKLTGVKLARESAVQQLQALRQCTGLTHLEINGTELRNCSAEQGHQAAVELRAALQGMHSLTCLHLDNWQLQPVTIFASALQPLTQLQHLHVVSSRLGVSALAALVPALSGMRGLETLDVCNNLNYINRRGEAQALCTLLGVAPGLTHLDVSWSCLRAQGAVLLASVLRDMTRLQTLKMLGCDIGDDGMATLAPALAALPHIHTLDLRFNALGARAVSALQPVWGRERSPLRKLRLGADPLELEGASAAAAGLSTATQLQQLSLFNTNFGDGGWVVALPQVLSCLAPSLQSLELGSDGLGTAGLATTALQMLTGLTRLQAVDIFTSAAMVTISPALMGMRRLQELDLQSTTMSTEAIAAIALVLPALAGSLKHLNLSHCSINAESAASALAPALAKATGLVELHLDGNAFGPQGALWLVPVLSSLPRLRKAGLSLCKLGLQGCMAVAHALRDRDGAWVHLGDNGVTCCSTEGYELCSMAGIHIRL